MLLLRVWDLCPPPMTIVRFVSGVGNLLGFFPTIMALSVPVFSVFSTCEIDVYGKAKKKKKNLTYCIKITILCAPKVLLCLGGFAHSLSHFPASLLAVKVSTRVVV